MNDDTGGLPARSAGWGLGTKAIHAGQTVDPTTGAVMPPIYATSTYAQSRPGVHQGFEYSRTHNATRYAYERCVAGLEDGSRGFAFPSPSPQAWRRRRPCSSCSRASTGPTSSATCR